MIFKTSKVVQELPQSLEADSLYAVRVGQGFDLYITDLTGNIAHTLNNVKLTESFKDAYTHIDNEYETAIDCNTFTSGTRNVVKISTATNIPTVSNVDVSYLLIETKKSGTNALIQTAISTKVSEGLLFYIRTSNDNGTSWSDWGTIYKDIDNDVIKKEPNLYYDATSDKLATTDFYNQQFNTRKYMYNFGGYKQTSNTDSWYTIAVNPGRNKIPGSTQCAYGEFLIYDSQSSKQQSLKLFASISYDRGTVLNILSNTYFSYGAITEIRIKHKSTYDGALLQIKTNNARINVIMDNNIKANGWTLLPEPVADGVANTLIDSMVDTTLLDVSDIVKVNDYNWGILTYQGIQSKYFLSNDGYYFTSLDNSTNADFMKHNSMTNTWNFVSNGIPSINTKGNSSIGCGSISYLQSNIKLAEREYDFTLSNNSATNVTVAHGLDINKIVGWVATVINTNGIKVAPDNNDTSIDSRYHITVDTTNIICRTAGYFDSTNIRNQTGKIIIKYEV